MLNLSAGTLLAQAGMIDQVAGIVPGQDDAAQDEAQQDEAEQDEAQQDEAQQGEAEQGEADSGARQTEDAIRADERLSDDQKAAMIAVCRSMLAWSPAAAAQTPAIFTKHSA